VPKDLAEKAIVFANEAIDKFQIEKVTEPNFHKMRSGYKQNHGE
jgi:hypothetical protein